MTISCFFIRHQTAATGIPSSLIWRKSDKKVFFIQEEKNEKLCTIDNEEFTSFQQIKERFGISPTKFLNQILNQDSNEISHFVKDLSPELEKLCDLEKRCFMHEKIEKTIQVVNILFPIV